MAKAKLYGCLRASIFIGLCGDLDSTLAKAWLLSTRAMKDSGTRYTAVAN
jgi:hypothetical protein